MDDGAPQEPWQPPAGPRPPEDLRADEHWRSVLTGDASAAPRLRLYRRLFKHLPSEPRCKLCYAPYGAPFGGLVQVLGFGRWPKNPSLCGACLRAMEKDLGGAEIELSFLFADLRGSTELSQGMPPAAYSRLLNAFYAIGARNIQAPGGNVDKYLGDGIFALFIPAFTAQRHAAAAIAAARGILRDTEDAPEIPAEARPLPIGIGVHTGMAYVGVLGTSGNLVDFTAIGESVNITSRLSAAAEARQLLISEAAAEHAELDTGVLEPRVLSLRGVTQPVRVWADRAAAPMPAAAG